MSAEAGRYLTAEEALARVAYGDAKALAGDSEPPGMPPADSVWGAVQGFGQPLRRHRTVWAMRYLVAKAKWRKRGRGAWLLPPLGRDRRSMLRHLWRQQEPRRTMCSLLAELLGGLKLATAAVEGRTAALNSASATLCGAILAGQLHPIGRPGAMLKRDFSAGQHAAIPDLFFAAGRRIITRYGWATLDRQCASGAEQRAWHQLPAPDWGDVRFPAREVEKLAPLPPIGVSNIRDETRLEKWLTEKMRASPSVGPGKTKVKAEAAAAGLVVPGRAFDRAYAAAVKRASAPAWSHAGAKSRR